MPITLYPYSMVVPDTTPKLELGEESIALTAAGGEGTIDVTAKNLPAEIQVRALTAEGAQGEVDWLTAEYADEAITYTAAANESTEARTAYIEVYVSNELKDGVAVTQAGKPATGAPVEVTDVLTRATTGITGTSYSAWSGKTSNSTAVYAGQSAGGNSSIQLRATSPSAIITTNSGGTAKKIVVTWNSSTSSGRTLDVYGKNTAYSATSDLYNSSTQGTKLGSIKYGTSTELVINGDYQYIALRSNSNAMYLTEIQITWETGGGSGGDVGGTTPDPEEPETPSYPENSYVKYSGALVEGDYIIVYEGKAMKNTVSSSRLGYSEVSPTNDYIVAPDASIVWHLAQNGDYWTIYNANANKYAASTGTKNQAQLLASGTDNKSLWTVSGTATYEFVNKNNKSNSVNANLRNNGTYGFACYATSTGGALTLYKKN